MPASVCVSSQQQLLPTSGCCLLCRLCVHRWGWEQLWNVGLASSAGSIPGRIYCGQNEQHGTITVSVSTNTITFDIMADGSFKLDDLHVYLACVPFGGVFAPGNLDCNPSKFVANGCPGTVQATMPAMNRAMGMISGYDACPNGQLYTIFHIGA